MRDWPLRENWVGNMAIRLESQPVMEHAELPTNVRQGTFVVVPAYNEAACIEGVLRELTVAYPNVVVVDDGSTDDSYAIARAVVPYTLRHLINRGQGAALQTGIEFALRRGAKYIVTFDADGQHRVQDIAALLHPISCGVCEITLGSRFLGEAARMPAGRRRLLRLAVLFTRLVNRVPLTDAHNGLRAFSRRAAEQINISMDRMAHASEIIDMIRNSRLPFREVPVQVRYTDHSLAKDRSLRDAVRIVFHYLVGRVVR
jgi:glycosyltransferase involved in cell wall biosynthesis